MKVNVMKYVVKRKKCKRNFSDMKIKRKKREWVSEHVS